MSFEYFTNLYIYFIIYGFLGWVVEVTYVVVFSGKITNRGFLNSPILPIYGFGSIFVIYFLTPFRENLIILFIFSVILTTSLEYVGATVMDHLFHMKWWDYSDHKYNIKGRVCLKNSLLFGIGCVFMMKFIHPSIESRIEPISISFKINIINLFNIIMFIDLFFTLKKLDKLHIRDIKYVSSSTKRHPMNINLSEKIELVKNDFYKSRHVSSHNDKKFMNVSSGILLIVGIILVIALNTLLGTIFVLIAILVIYVVKNIITKSQNTKHKTYKD